MSGWKHVHELRIHLCQSSPASQGLRNFLHKNYAALKKANPQTPILIREAAGSPARIFARFERGREERTQVDNLTSEQIDERLQALVDKK